MRCGILSLTMPPLKPELEPTCASSWALGVQAFVVYVSTDEITLSLIAKSYS